MKIRTSAKHIQAVARISDVASRFPVKIPSAMVSWKCLAVPRRFAGIGAYLLSP